MKCVEEIRISNRLNPPLAEFLATYPILLWLADEADLTPVDFIADAFVEEVEPREQYCNWVVRQVKETLEAQLWRDNAAGFESGLGTHSCQHIARVEFDDADRQTVLDMFAGRDDVRQVWERAHVRKLAQAA